MTRVRIDHLLSERGLFPSRSRAAASVLAGEVLLLPSRERVAKPGLMVPDDVAVEVVAGRQYVSRGGVKLANALDGFGISVDGRRCLDVGASTGGFTDCLLQRGAAAVAALDVAYGQLDWSLRSDERVTVIERVNARAVSAAELPWVPSLVVIDVSFISLTKVLPAVLGVVAEGGGGGSAAPGGSVAADGGEAAADGGEAAADRGRFDCLAMIKPQFEVGRSAVGKGGVVRDAGARRDALVGVAACALSLGASVLGFAPSGLPGPKGNLETFVWLAEAGREGALAGLAEVEAAAREVEP